MRAKKVQKKWKGSGYAFILFCFRDGYPFTVASAQQLMVSAGITTSSRRASDCVTRMQKTSESSTKNNYINWIGTLKKAGKNQLGENLYCVSGKGKNLGEKIAAAVELGLNLREHHLAKRIDKKLLIAIPKRGYFKKSKVYDPLQRTKIIRR